MQIFYAPDLNGTFYTLSEEESKHCIRVLRLNQGDNITLVDGKGGLYQTRITDTNPKKCRVEVYQSYQNYQKRSFSLHVAIAPTKNIERFEWFLEKATEIGVDEITPLLCEHSERKVINAERLNKIIISAMKQSVKAFLPKLNELTTIHQFCDRYSDPSKFIAHCHSSNLIPIKNKIIKGQNITILIGPEGDFSSVEIVEAKNAGFTEVSLGNSRLRTETAGIVACTISNSINE